MFKMIAAVIAAAACAGVIAFLPGFTPGLAAGATQSAAPSTLSSPTINENAVEVVPTSDMRTATDSRQPTEQNLRHGSRNPKVVCVQSWPYYEQSCLRDGRAAPGNPRVVRVIVADRSAASRAALARR
jgi:hypothetical protein